MSEFKWHTQELPLITKCCKSLNWSNVISDDGKTTGDYCYKCEEVIPDNVRRITQLEYDTLTHPDITIGGLLDPKRMYDLMNPPE